MKNVFFALAFMLVGTFAFASSNEIVELKEDIKVENVNSSDTLQSNNYVVSDYSLSELFCIVWGDYVDDNGNIVGSWVVIHPGTCDEAIHWIHENL